MVCLMYTTNVSGDGGVACVTSVLHVLNVGSFVILIEFLLFCIFLSCTCGCCGSTRGYIQAKLTNYLPETNYQMMNFYFTSTIVI